MSDILIMTSRSNACYGNESVDAMHLFQKKNQAYPIVEWFRR